MRNTCFFISLLFSSAACSTIGETISPYDSSSSYRKKKGTSNTYVRKRVIRKRPRSDYHDPWSDSWEDRRRPNNYSLLGESINLVLSSSSQDTATTPRRNLNATDQAASAQLGLRYGISWAVPEEKDESAFQFGFEAEGDTLNDWLAVRLGASIFNSDLTYWGVTLGARSSVPHWILSPYVGIEGYVGDHKSCAYEDLNEDEYLETCEKTFLATAYLEGGARLKLLDEARIYLFARGYSKIDQTRRRKLVMFYGASLMFGF